MSKLLFLYVLLLTLSVDSCAPASSVISEKEEYYSMHDFPTVEKFDSHIHLNTLQQPFIEQAAADNVKFLDIVDDRPFGVPMHEQEKIAIAQTNVSRQDILCHHIFRQEFQYAGVDQQCDS